MLVREFKNFERACKKLPKNLDKDLANMPSNYLIEWNGILHSGKKSQMGNGFKATEKKKGKNIVTITDTDSRKIMEQTKKGEIIKVLDVKQRVNPFNKKMEQNISNKMEMKGEIPEEHTNEDWEFANKVKRKFGIRNTTIRKLWQVKWKMKWAYKREKRWKRNSEKKMN